MTNRDEGWRMNQSVSPLHHAFRIKMIDSHIVDYGKLESATSNTALLRSTAAMVFGDNELVGMTALIVSEPGAGQYRIVMENAGNTITVFPWDVDPDGSEYALYAAIPASSVVGGLL